MKRLAAAVVALAVVSGGAVGAVGALRTEPTTHTLSPIVPTQAPTPTPDVPAPSATPTALPPVTPSALPAPVPTLVPTKLPTIPVVTAVPTVRPTVAPPTQGHWKHTENGVTLDVMMRPQWPRAGDLVTYTLVTSSERECCTFDLAFGDHQGARESSEYCLAHGDRAPAGDDTFVVRHAYRLPGTYTPRIQVGANCSTGPWYFGITPTIRIGPGPLLSNGPLQPVVSLDDSVVMEGEPEAAGQWFNGHVADHDGYPVSWTWTWGDGTTTEGRNPEACRPGPYGNFTDQDAPVRDAHRFARTGTFRVTLTVVSAGCDGLQRQTASASMEWVVAAGDPGAPQG